VPAEIVTVLSDDAWLEEYSGGLVRFASCPKQANAAKRKKTVTAEWQANFPGMVVSFEEGEIGEALGPYRRGHVMEHLIRKL
jgi:hypothetical protein